MVVGPDCANNGRARHNMASTTCWTVRQRGVDIDSSPGLQSHCMVSLLATTRTHFCSARSAFWVTGALRCDCQSNGGNDNGGRLFCLRIFLKSRKPNKISDQGKFRPVGCRHVRLGSPRSFWTTLSLSAGVMKRFNAKSQSSPARFNFHFCLESDAFRSLIRRWRAS